MSSRYVGPKLPGKAGIAQRAMLAEKKSKADWY